MIKAGLPAFFYALNLRLKYYECPANKFLTTDVSHLSWITLINKAMNHLNVYFDELKRIKPLVLLMALTVVIISGCKEEEEPQFKIGPVNQSSDINNWIFEQMDLWYYWTDELGSKPTTNLTPADFYESLLVDQDRFSFIYEDYQELIDLLNGVQLESGYEFKLYYEPESITNVIILITYIKKGSPADEIGLKRGDAIYSINGTQITDANYQLLLTELESAYSAEYRRYDSESAAFIDQGEIEVTPVTVSENPLLLDTIYEISGKKIGYMVYTGFSNGPTQGSTIYNDEMDMIFSEFQSQGITDFILDLRFNGGGSEFAAKNLASLVVNATSEDLMFKKQYNAGAQDFFQNDDRYGDEFLNIKFAEKAQNIGSMIGNKVHVITSNRSASASELVINSFLPFMDVFIVGDTTVGKDVGSATFSETENSNNNWAIQPIIVKIINKNNQDYPEGFFPDVVIKDNFIILQPLGDINEPLLNAALSEIGIQNARKTFSNEESQRLPLFESRQEKFGDGNLIMESPILPERR